jgi:1,2-diacylglycerol 3-alpha-glucosyltransferase
MIRKKGGYIPPRIVVASSGLGHVTRGVEIWAADLAKALWERQVPVVLCKGAGAVAAEYERVIPCWRRDAPKTRTLLRWLPNRLTWRAGVGSSYDVEQISFALGLVRYLRRDHADILHVQDPGVARILQRAGEMRLIRTKTILAHGTEESDAFLARIKFVQQLAPWHLQRSQIAGVARSTWTAIPNFVDTTRFKPGDTVAARTALGISPTAAVILSVAAIKRHHKRVDWLLDEVGVLRQRQPELDVCVVVAGGWEADTDALIEQGHREHGSRVKFLVRIPSDQMPTVYRAADIFTLCSLQEMMPIALLEAMASGLPCITHPFPVAQWMKGAGGEDVDMTSRGALALAWEHMVTDRDMRLRLGQAARRHCEDQFATDRVVDQILDYYDFVSRS